MVHASDPTILVVDDDPAVRDALEAALRGFGHPVAACGSAEDVVAWIAEGHRPSLVFLDLVLPGMSGEELLRRLHADARFRSVPVVLVTGMPPEALGRIPVDAYLPKPVVPTRLAAVVRAFLDPPRRHG